MAKSYTFKCPDDVIECQETGKCWGWMRSHTYKPFSELLNKESVYITKIDYSVNSGVSENTGFVYGVIEVLDKDGKWFKVGDWKVIGSDSYKDFSVSVNKEVKQVRIRATSSDSPWQNAYYVDGSKITIYVKDEDNPPAPPPIPPIPKPDFSNWLIYGLIGVAIIIIVYLLFLRK